MGIFDFITGSKLKKELETIKVENEQLKSLLTPEMQDVANLKLENIKLKDLISSQQAELNQLERRKSELALEINQKHKELITLDDDIIVQEFGLYTPRFDFMKAEDFKIKLTKIREQQKALIKNKQAVSGAQNWTVNGSNSQGNKMVSDIQKLLLRAFNNECDELVSKIKYTNLDTSINRIQKSAETISKLGKVLSISISNQYINLKIQELMVAFEYQQQKQKDKEALRQAREDLREQQKLQKEIDEQRKKFEKEQKHYQNAYKSLLEQLASNPNDKNLIDKKEEIENHLSEVSKSIQNIDYREANIKAGYVYVISNIGAFGENVYKIGMTRRLEPQDRVDELGDASVPFRFDVHAMIFSDNAPALENALHKAFEDKKVNMVNQRREFFNVTLDEIKEVIKKNFDKTVEFTDVPDAEQYRVSKKMKEELQNNNHSIIN
nr:MAG TPA: helicase [Caudoviricetes sp.]